MRVVFDLDGTLADADHRNPLIMGPGVSEPEPERKANWAQYYALCEFDPPVKPIIAIFHAMQAAGHRCEIWTGRSVGVIDKTLEWFSKYDIRPTVLLMRPIGDHRPDTELKGQWLEECLGPVDLVIEDRARMIEFWRSKGIMALQCAPGNF